MTISIRWVNRSHRDRILTNPYAKEAKMVALRTGNAEAGDWVEESVNIIENYREAFGINPPSNASLAIMSDTDNTGESATAISTGWRFRDESTQPHPFHASDENNHKYCGCARQRRGKGALTPPA